MKKLRYIPILCLLYLSIFSSQIDAATTYFISATGDVNAPCTTTQPCNFARAQALADFGDIISIQGKIGAVRITKPGLTLRDGIVDGSNLREPDSAAILIEANNTTLEDLEIINGWSYGFRTKNGISNTIAKRLNLHHNVRENFLSADTCNANNTHGWGSAMRAYFADSLTISDSYIWENCGEGFSAVMSKNVHGTKLTIWDNWSVNVYPDQTQNFSLTNSSIYCFKPGFNRFTRSRSFLLGAEDSYGPTTNTTRDITFKSNSIYNCRGLSAYQEATGNFTNITLTNNIFYNLYGNAYIEGVVGTNIISSPNTVTTLSPVTTPIPTHSPLPSPKPGDLNGDNHVNIIDFNLLISNFGNPYTIFDFNEIVSNYGT